MEEWVTAHEESLNSMEVNTSEDAKSSVEHGESSSTQPSSSPSSSSVYHSVRIESMIEDRHKFSSELEFNIQYSKDHWSQLAIPASITDTDDDDDTDYSPEADLELFKRLCKWGTGFFHDFGQSLVVGEKIAEGAQAEIYAATRFGSYECVLKMFKQGYALRDLQRQWPEGITTSYAWLSEIGLSQGTHETRLQDGKGYFKWCIYGGTLLRDERFKNRFAFVMKRQWGDLRKAIDLQMLGKKNHGAPFAYAKQMLLMLRIAEDMRDLHQQLGIIHRDLKASNVLVPCSHKTTSFGSVVTVADFECSIGVIGTGFWRAPEILQQLKNRIPTSRIRFSFAADIYSYGMTCYEIITGRIPFEGHSSTEYDVVLNGERPELPCDVPHWVRELIYDCWNPDPSRRPYFSDIVHRIMDGDPNLGYYFYLCNVKRGRINGDYIRGGN
jgi:hypothetical protein